MLTATNLNPAANVVYVDDDWAGTGIGNNPIENGVPGTLSFGFNAFADVQSAVNAVALGGTIVVFGGNYAGNLNLNKVVTSIQVSTNPEDSTPDGTVTIGGTVLVGADTTFDMVPGTGTSPGSTAGNLTFVSTINAGVAGTAGLTFNGNGTLTITSTVGTTSALEFFTRDSQGTTILNGGNITTTVSQSFGDSVVLGADTVFNTGAGDVTFTSTSSLNGGFSVLVNSTGNFTFAGNAGGTTPLQTLTSNPGGTAIVSGSITTTGNQLYADAFVTNGNAQLAATAGNVTFNLTVNGPGSLAVNATGNTTFLGNIGATTALTNLSTGAGGNTVLQAGNFTVNTTSDQTYGDAVVLFGNTTFNSSSAGNITFGSTVNPTGNFSIAVNTSGNTTFNGNVAGLGGTQNVTTLITDAGGNTLIGGNITTSGLQHLMMLS